MTKEITNLKSKNFSEFVKKGTAVVDFWAVWCGPCKIMEPIFDEVAEELKGKVKFGKVNVDENSEIAQKFEVMSIPTLIIFKEGKQIDRVIGVIEKEDLIDKIKSVK